MNCVAVQCWNALQRRPENYAPCIANGLLIEGGDPGGVRDGYPRRGDLGAASGGWPFESRCFLPTLRCGIRRTITASCSGTAGNFSPSPAAPGAPGNWAGISFSQSTNTAPASGGSRTATTICRFDGTTGNTGCLSGEEKRSRPQNQGTYLWVEVKRLAQMGADPGARALYPPLRGNPRQIRGRPGGSLQIHRYFRNRQNVR